MKKYISLLRGINVGGHKKIIMTDLKALYMELGFKNVSTYIQSGNIVFDSKEESFAVLEKMIFDKIKRHYSFEVPILILTPKEIAEAINGNPYPTIEKVYFTFLADLPQPENVREFNAITFNNEFFELKNKVIYSYYPNGAGKAKMNHTFIERKLKVNATTRNLRTVNKLLEMCKV